MSEFEIAKIFKVKDSIAVIILKKIAERINLENGQYVKISIKNREIIIAKIFQNNKTDTTSLWHSSLHFSVSFLLLLLNFYVPKKN